MMLIVVILIIASIVAGYAWNLIDNPQDVLTRGPNYIEPECDIEELIEYLKDEFKGTKAAEEKSWSITVEISKRGTVKNIRLNQLDGVMHRPQLLFSDEQYKKANSLIKVISPAIYKGTPINGQYYQYLGDIFN